MSLRQTDTEEFFILKMLMYLLSQPDWDKPILQYFNVYSLIIRYISYY